MGIAVHAQRIVAIWNARHRRACPVVLSDDRRAPLSQPRFRHPGALISSLIPWVSCRRCSPSAPFARLETLTGCQPSRLRCRSRPVKPEALGDDRWARLLRRLTLSDWQLDHGRALSFAKGSQQDDLTGRQFERIVMPVGFVLVHATEPRDACAE